MAKNKCQFSTTLYISGEQGLFLLGGEMEGGRKFVGIQDLTFNVDLRQV